MAPISPDLACEYIIWHYNKPELFSKNRPVPEFDLINRFFKNLNQQREDVVLGIGDDCAILQVPADKHLVVSTDTLVSGVHFPDHTSAYDIGYKSLAVNLSDLAAMGAEPAWATLCLTLPDENALWLEGFVKGFSELLNKHNMQLVGGDTTQGPLSISVHVTGFVDKTNVMRRDMAKLGELIYVTGTIGDAGVGLKQVLDNQYAHGFCVDRLNRPDPRNDFAIALATVSCCAIDISDGLLADLGHICEQSQCGAEILLNQIPSSSALKFFYKNTPDMGQVLTSGDDYELCFTIDEKYKDRLNEISRDKSTPISCIGKITGGDRVICLDENNHEVKIQAKSYEHF